MAQRDPDPTARQFAIMALAELAGRDPDVGAGSSKERQDLLKKLSVLFTDGIGDSPRQKADRPWYAMAGALYARRFDAFKPAMTKALIRLAETAGARDDRAAAAVGLGLLRGDAATEALRRLLGSTSDAKVVGYAAESLGMHGDLSVRDRLLEMARTHSDDGVRYRAVMGLARLREPSLVPAFVAALGESRSQTVQAALTRAIGTIGDRSAIGDLVRMAADAERDRASRERAVGALGLIGQAGDIAWSMDFKRGCNFAADSPALRTVLGTF
jgi:HEAT repeat protein